MSRQTLERDGWLMCCSFCNNNISYTLINNYQAPVPFFYAEDCNDVLLRKSDKRQLDNIMSKENSNSLTIETLDGLWNRFVQKTPVTRNGGAFGLWTNVKCPHCYSELPYNGGVRNIEIRIYEPKIVLIDRAWLIGDTKDESWEVRVRLQERSH